MGEVKLTEHDAMALNFLIRNGPDQPGVIDSEEVMCATLFFLELSKRGLVRMERDEGGPIFSITPAGRAAIASMETVEGGGEHD